jgi:hypothetical protein
LGSWLKLVHQPGHTVNSIEGVVARAFGLRSNRQWQGHANPWSVYTRMPILPLLSIAIWSRVWIGWWALVPVGLMLVWTIVNPRIFPPPRSFGSWAARGVLGESYWAARKETPVPSRHRLAPVLLTAVSAVGFPFWVWGLVSLEPWLTAFGLVIQMGAKLWFFDRMALLYDDMTSSRQPAD